MLFLEADIIIIKEINIDCLSQDQRMHFLQTLFQMTVIVLVSVIKHYHINRLHLFWDSLSLSLYIYIYIYIYIEKRERERERKREREREMNKSVKTNWNSFCVFYFWLFSTGFKPRSPKGEMFSRKKVFCTKIISKKFYLEYIFNFKSLCAIRQPTKKHWWCSISICWRKIILWNPSVFNWPLYIYCQNIWQSRLFLKGIDVL